LTITDVTWARFHSLKIRYFPRFSIRLQKKNRPL